jgi:transcriptional regulator with GAF, ATPase, and Fis domain
MKERPIWYKCICENNSPPLCELVDKLSSLDVELYPSEQGDPSHPGIIFFDTNSQHLFDMLRGQAGRVLTVAFSQEAIKGFSAWRLLGAGASDVFLWTQPSELAAMIDGRLKRWQTIDSLVYSPLVYMNLVGRSRIWIALLRQVVEVAHLTQSSVLITGESGTGKELVARLIHTLDTRSEKRDLVILDCSTIVPELSGSEFFGHERGAFTNAANSRDGVFALSHMGTLFLDEVGELPIALQAALLRVVEEKNFKRVGGNQWRQTDFRLVCATNRDLAEEERQGRFRRDFYYRIAAFTCRLPPLRERQEDILPLACHFWKQLNPERPVPEFDPVVCDYLRTRNYPGNVRDLRQLILRMSNRHAGGGLVTAGVIPRDDRPEVAVETSEWRDQAFERAVRAALSSGLGLKEIGRAAEETAERIALEDENGNLQRAAQKLGVTDRALQMRRANRRQQLG